MTIRMQLPKWYDLHAHVRQGELLLPVVQDHLSAGCAGLLAMPNTLPPVIQVAGQSMDQAWSIESYRERITAAAGDTLDQLIVPLYLSEQTTPEVIEAGVASGLLKACKYYPPHGTTNAGHSQPFSRFVDNGVLAAMEANNVVLCVHGEVHDLEGADYFDQHRNAEIAFYESILPGIVERYPKLRIVGEHLTTKVAVDFVEQAGDQVAATITPQHMLYTVADLLRGLKYHLYCLPLLKFEQDREALCTAVMRTNNQSFFAGTDSAPHTKKATACGCAAGCYTAPIGPQLYAQAFEAAGLDLSVTDNQQTFKQFLCENGPAFYGFTPTTDTFELVKTPQPISVTPTPQGDLVPLPVGLNPSHEETGTQLDWSVQGPSPAIKDGE